MRCRCESGSYGPVAGAGAWGSRRSFAPADEGVVLHVYTLLVESWQAPRSGLEAVRAEPARGDRPDAGARRRPGSAARRRSNAGALGRGTTARGSRQVSPPVVAAAAVAVTGALRHPSPSVRPRRSLSGPPCPLHCWNRSRPLNRSPPPPRARLGGGASGLPSSCCPRSCSSPSRGGSPGTGFSLAPRHHPCLRPPPR